MITGYALTFLTLVILLTSYLRHSKGFSYRAFYVLHHLVIVFYVGSIAHTMDNEFRHLGKQRSQTFKWIAASAIVYICDRLYRNLSAGWTSRKAVPIVGITAEHYTLDVRLDRPFKVSAGDWAHISAPALDGIVAHPFSVSQGATLYDVVFVISRPTRTGGSDERARSERTWRSRLLCALTAAPDAAAVDELAKSAPPLPAVPAPPARMAVKSRTSTGAPSSFFGGGPPGPVQATQSADGAVRRVGVRYLKGEPVRLKVMGPYSSSFPPIGLADQVVCIGLGSGCVAVLSVFLRSAAKVVESAAQVRVATQPRSAYEWADAVLRKVHRRRRARKLAADNILLADERSATNTGKLAVDSTVDTPSLTQSAKPARRVQGGARARVHGGVALSTYGQSLRARCDSVRWLLLGEVARLAFIAVSLIGAGLALSFATQPLVGGSTVGLGCAAPESVAHGLAMPVVFYANATIQLLFFARTVRRAMEGQWASLFRARASPAGAGTDDTDDKPRLLITDYTVVLDVAVRARARAHLRARAPTRAQTGACARPAHSLPPAFYPPAARLRAVFSGDGRLAPPRRLWRAPAAAARLGAGVDAAPARRARAHDDVDGFQCRRAAARPHVGCARPHARGTVRRRVARVAAARACHLRRAWSLVGAVNYRPARARAGPAPSRRACRRCAPLDAAAVRDDLRHVARRRGHGEGRHGGRARRAAAGAAARAPRAARHRARAQWPS